MKESALNLRKIHVVSFQVPFPPNYGGVIDVYYKLRALKEEGYSIILHTYVYSRERSEEALSHLADEVHYYERATGILSQFSVLPYIVKSRSDNRLLANLLKDDHPILFEGLHTGFFLSRPELKNRVKMVRAHNIEHEYYRYLEQSCASLWKRAFFKIESWRLKRFERILHHATHILAISTGERDYFSRSYPGVKVELLPCFFEQDAPGGIPGQEPYILYHGNLAVEENENAALYILDNIAPRLPEFRFVIAGADPGVKLRESVARLSHVTLLANPPKEEMDELVFGARIHLLITFQNTGVKLKLLNALYKGAYCIVNSAMVAGSMLDQLCVIADGAPDIVEAIKARAGDTYTPEQKEARIAALNQLYSCNRNISVITEACVGK